MMTKGQHVIADIYLEEYNIDNSDFIDLCELALADSGMNILGRAVHEFGVGAFTGVWLLSESHFSIHTFPERLYVSVDIYTCGGGKPINALNKLLTGVSVRDADLRVLSRGV